MVGADAAWIMTATALVLFMTLPGLALFYGGLVRARNVLSVFMHCYAIAALMSVLWFVAGYSIAFGPGESGVWGGLGKLFLAGMDADSLAGTLPEILFFAFQMTFAVITPALIVGAYVERVGFGFVLLFSGLWMLIVYAPVVHWIWGGGMMADGGIFGETGVRDFAGGIVVHETAGLASLVIAAMLGARRDRSKPPHAPSLVMMGAAMLWVGWFGFNGGSQLAADGGAAMAIAVTHLSAATASLSWALWERIKYGKASLVGIVTGTIAGLATITPASGFVSPAEAVGLGAVAGILCQEAVNFVRNVWGLDDTLDVFAVHGVGGTVGALLTGVFASAPLIASHPAGAVLAEYGRFSLILGQLQAVLVAYGLAAGGTLVIAVALRQCGVPFRVNDDAERLGVDIEEHGEEAYGERTGSPIFD